MKQDHFELCEVTLNNIDKKILRSYFDLADMIGDLIGGFCEVAIHSFESFDNSIVKIVNGHLTGRTVGAPITDFGLKILHSFEHTGERHYKSYFTKNKKGESLKSSTQVITGTQDRAIGMICINLNIATPFAEVINAFSNNFILDNLFIHEDFSANTKEIIDDALAKAIQSVNDDASINSKIRNKTIISALFDSGVFELKDAVAIVADHLGITRNSVYKFIREFKANSLKEGRTQITRYE